MGQCDSREQVDPVPKYNMGPAGTPIGPPRPPPKRQPGPWMNQQNQGIARQSTHAKLQMLDAQKDQKENVCHKFFTEYLCYPCMYCCLCFTFIYNNFFWRAWDRLYRCCCACGRKNEYMKLTGNIDDLFETMNFRLRTDTCKCGMEYIDDIEAQKFALVAELGEQVHRRGAWWKFIKQHEHGVLLEYLKCAMQMKLDSGEWLTEKEFRAFVLNFFLAKSNKMVDDLKAFLEERYTASTVGEIPNPVNEGVELAERPEDPNTNI